MPENTTVYLDNIPSDEKRFYKKMKMYDLADGRQQLAKALADTMLDAKSAQVSYSTLQTYTHALKHLSSFFGNDIENITPAMLQLVINNMAAQGLSRSYRNLDYFLTTDFTIFRRILTDFSNRTKKNINTQKPPKHYV